LRMKKRTMMMMTMTRKEKSLTKSPSPESVADLDSAKRSNARERVMGIRGKIQIRGESEADRPRCTLHWKQES